MSTSLAPAGPDELREDAGALTRWLTDKKAAAIVLRPDGFIYAAGGSGSPLPPPPESLLCATRPAAHRNGATA